MLGLHHPFKTLEISTKKVFEDTLIYYQEHGDEPVTLQKAEGFMKQLATPLETFEVDIPSALKIAKENSQLPSSTPLQLPQTIKAGKQRQGISTIMSKTAKKPIEEDKQSPDEFSRTLSKPKYDENIQTHFA